MSIIAIIVYYGITNWTIAFGVRGNCPEFVILDEEFAEQLCSWPKYVAMWREFGGKMKDENGFILLRKNKNAGKNIRDIRGEWVYIMDEM